MSKVKCVFGKIQFFADGALVLYIDKIKKNILRKLLPRNTAKQKMILMSMTLMLSPIYSIRI